MAQQTNPQWQFKVHIELTHPTQDQVWSIVADFFNIHKCLPLLDTSFGVSGVPTKTGCVRCCVKFNGDGSIKTWVIEKLVELDHAAKSLAYEILANNIGYSSYRASMKVMPRPDKDEKYGCLLEWSFVMDPIKGKRYEQMLSYHKFILRTIGKKIEDAHSYSRL